MVGVPVLYNRPRLKAQGPCHCGFLTPRSPVSVARALADRGRVALELSEPLSWDRRNELAASAGVYVIAKADPANTVYIGRTWGSKGVKQRIGTFNRSAVTGRKGHAGGVTYHHTFGPHTDDLWVSVHIPTDVEVRPEILHPYIAYAERRFIWEFVDQYRRLPACNSE